MRVGITGHQELTESSGWDWVIRSFDALLSAMPKPLVGITCLAAGADQLFAQAVLRNFGTIEVVLPFPEYESTLDEESKQFYRQLHLMASKITVLTKQSTTDESYLKAGKIVVDLSDVMVAVWNGRPAGGLGGTADIVEYAKKKKKVVWLNPVIQQIMNLPE